MVTQHSKAHHFLPQFYLRKFQSNKRGSKQHLIWRFDKQTGKIVEINIAEVCHQKHFHEVKDIDGNTVHYEDDITRIENQLLGGYEAICNDFSLKTLEAEALRLATFVAFLMVRSAVVRKDLDDLRNEIINVIAPTVAPGAELPLFTEEHTRGQHYKFMSQELADVTNKLGNLRWVLVENRTAIPFLTSDYPFAIARVEDNIIWPVEDLPDGLPTDSLWLETPSVRLFFPLTPRLMFLICDPVTSYQIPAVIRPTPASVQEANKGQVLRSQRFIFSHVNSFDLVKRMIRESPHLQDTNRPRWKIQLSRVPVDSEEQDSPRSA